LESVFVEQVRMKRQKPLRFVGINIIIVNKMI